MKFKPNATEEAIYKLLAIVSAFFYLQGVFLLLLAFVYATQANGEAPILTVTYVLAGAIVAIIGEAIRKIRSEMIE